PYETDGMVVKIDSFALQERLGAVGREPRWAVAYKFPAVQGRTRLLDIGINVGRTGTLNPFAILEPVTVGGVTIRMAALHNEDDIHRKDIRIGDMVIVQRAGEVIPQVVGPVVSLRAGNESIFYMPQKCPACGADVVREPGEAAHRCTNAACPSQAYERIKHFVSREAMDIRGIGEQMVATLLREGLIKDMADIYYLTKEQLLSVERMGDKSAGNIIAAIGRSKDRPLANVVFALGILHVGGETARLLVRRFPSMERLADASLEELREVLGIGPVVAESVFAFFRQKENRDLIERLRRAGVRMAEEKPAVPAEGPLAGQEFIITGKLESFTRAQAEALVEELGGKAGDTVTRRTTCLVVGEDPGSKLARAQQLGTKQLTEVEFLRLIEEARATRR
ncbi:MAG: NAD-dependent DNA ligase LigA, partial [Chloroflexi bacterium]|nr:NAD-dependent DNA ligase LigA [Chloroflexota bacterium]